MFLTANTGVAVADGGVSFAIYILSVIGTLLVQGGSLAILIKYWLGNQNSKFTKLQKSIDALTESERQKTAILAGMNTTIEIIKTDIGNQKSLYSGTRADVVLLQGKVGANELKISTLQGDIKLLKAQNNGSIT